MLSLRQLLHDARKIGVAPRTVAVLVCLQLLASAFELLGLASFLPIFQFLNHGGSSEALSGQGGLWPYIVAASNALGVKISLAALLIGTLLILLVRQALAFSCEYYEFGRRESAIARMRASLFGAFLRASSDAQDKASSGGMVQDMGYNSLRAAQHVFSRFGLVSQSMILLVYAAGMLILNVHVTLFLSAILGLSLLVAYPHILRARRYGSELVSANKNSAEFVIERLRLARLVRLSRMEGQESGVINRLSFRQRDVSVSIWRTLATVDMMLESLAVSIALLFVYVATSFFGVAVEVVGLMIAMLLRLVPVVRQLARTKQFADGARASYDSVVLRSEELNAARERYQTGEALKGMRAGIVFDNVSFVYCSRTDAPALANVSFTVEHARTTAIVGPSGSGKSTLIDLLPRLREPQSGRILIDGLDTKAIELGSLRAAVAFVSQAPLIFDVPLIDHIRYGAPAASIDEVQEAAWLSGAKEFIDGFPDGYQTLAGEGGKRLSGGQRQRLDLARALLSKAPILILDEPTTGLDAESAKHLFAALARIRSSTDTTVIIVTHDLASIAGADKIVVMDRGRVASVGRHDQLKAQDGWYARAVGMGGETARSAGKM